MKKLIRSKYFTIVFRIVAIAGVIVLALYLPGVLFKYEDQRMNGQVNAFQVDVKTYANQYNGFDKILEAMTDDKAWDNLSVVSISNNEELMTDEQLIEAVKQEVKKVYSYTDFAEEIQLENMALKQRQLISLYSQDSKNPLNGIQLWKLVLENEQYRMNVVLEADFQKICMLEMKPLATKSQYEKTNVKKYQEIGYDIDWGATEYYYGLSNGSSLRIVGEYKVAELQKMQIESQQNQISLKEVTGYQNDNVLFIYSNEQLHGDGDPLNFQMGIWQIYQMIQF